MKRAWYLDLSAEDIGDRAILIGDPDRVDRIAQLLEEPTFLPVSRGLKTVTGRFGGKTITVTAFGMGAPIATIVLHELADLGVTRFLRIGTAMYFAPGKPGDLMISDAALGFDGTSAAYASGTDTFMADTGLADAIDDAASRNGLSTIRGLYATFDAFYRDMFGIDEEGRARASTNRERLAARNVLAIDMETSALLAAATALNVSCATLCLGTVDALTQEKLPLEKLSQGEKQLFQTALDGLSSLL
ncbi:uridine phosphorylase [Hoeflea prorocentri]|uniref:Uridine phosphorylase n=1 Tax=Hoeflea prorocentri TaxID=1922333 RepID=A0A9X3ZGU8_9HYPH|nr:uridine phosphorylase [Hoeflea prorocentri]MCY6380191.1 uridine phosphorylase [Hoeflea prorocentri]MDA5397991.1 uridine phosphorylase [Hoeflea prorocentri]